MAVGRENYIYIVANKEGEQIVLSNYDVAKAEMKRYGLMGEPTRLQVHRRVGDAKFSRGVPITKFAKGARRAA